ncbi:MAG: hypothetical protein LC118_17450 [Dehalococcoidia bacterium]|nr:hypothetical protein [Dehalococcoidia bacterium]
MNDYLDHVRQLAQDSGIRVWVNLDSTTEWGMSALDGDGDPIVFLGMMPDTLEGYLIALHELGHHHDPDWGKPTKLDREAHAWRWALKHQLLPHGWGTPPEAWEIILKHISEYVRDGRFRRTPAFENLLADAERAAKRVPSKP